MSEENFTLIEFQDKSLDVVQNSDVLSSLDYDIGQEIIILWPPPGNKQKAKEYKVTVVEKSNNKDDLDRKLELMIIDEGKDEEFQEGKKRVIKPTRKVLDEEEIDEPLPRRKKRPTDKKARKEAIMARTIFQKLGLEKENFVEEKQKGSCCNKLEEEVDLLSCEISCLRSDNNKLKEQVASLEAELQIARDLKQYLKQAKRLVKKLSPENLQTSMLRSYTENSIDPGMDSVLVIKEEELAPHPHLLWSRTSEDVVELLPKSGIYLKERMKATLPNTCRSAAILTRALLENIFTREALSTCSVKGRVANGVGKPGEQREGLYQPAVNCIIDFIQILRKERGWIKDSDPKDVVKTMGNKLCETRRAQRLLQITSPNLCL